MDPFEGLHLEVISNGKALELYLDSDNEPSQDPRVRQRYIEAVTGAIFRVRITVDEKFRLCTLGQDDAVRVTINFDGQPLSWHLDLAGSRLRSLRAVGRAAECLFTHRDHWCSETQQWKRGETTFGTLVTTDTSDVTTSVPEAQDLGRIQVRIQRIHRTKRDTPRRPIKNASDVITEVPEKVLKGKAITNTIRTTNEVPSDEPSCSDFDTKPIDGDDGKPLLYNIFYRSKQTLQMLGCIPRTPSPEPEILAANVIPTAREAEMKSLQARLAYLENAAKLKAEGSNPDFKIKRELHDAGDETSSGKRRKPGAVETVDLTND